MDSLNSNSQNIRSAAAVNATQYATDAKVTQYGKAGNDIKDYTFVGMFPTDLAPIDLDWGSNDTIEEYSVTFAYQYWESNSTT